MAKRTRETKSTEGTELVKRYDGRTVRQPRAIAWLMNKHREVEGYFDQFEDTDDAQVDGSIYTISSRVGGHVAEVRKTFGGQEPAGRRLDFLMQELNREANTLSSKSQDIETTRAAVDMKVLIEQMREQVQNIE